MCLSPFASRRTLFSRSPTWRRSGNGQANLWTTLVLSRASRVVLSIDGPRPPPCFCFSYVYLSPPSFSRLALLSCFSPAAPHAIVPVNSSTPASAAAPRPVIRVSEVWAARRHGAGRSKIKEDAYNRGRGVSKIVFAHGILMNNRQFRGFAGFGQITRPCVGRQRGRGRPDAAAEPCIYYILRLECG